MEARQENILRGLRRGFPAHALVAFLFLALAARSGSDFFHTEGPECAGAAISAPCNACDVEATTVLHAPPPPVLPPRTVSQVETVISSEARPFVPVILHTQGRAPPIS